MTGSGTGLGTKLGQLESPLDLYMNVGGEKSCFLQGHSVGSKKPLIASSQVNPYRENVSVTGENEASREKPLKRNQKRNEGKNPDDII